MMHAPGMDGGRNCRWAMSCFRTVYRNEPLSVQPNANLGSAVFLGPNRPVRRGFLVYGNVEWTDAGLGPRRTLADVPKRREDVEKLFSRVRNATLIRLPPGGATKIRFGQRIDSIVALLAPARDFFNSFQGFAYTAESGPIARPYTNRGHRVPACGPTNHADPPTAKGKAGNDARPSHKRWTR